jgi:glycosyltransferase involved in cell wall biosynthesis
MSKEFTAHLPLNSVSFGQTSILLLRTYLDNYDKYKDIANLDKMFLIGQPDFSAQEDNPEFQKTVNDLLNNGLDKHKRSMPSFKLWHLNGSMESISNDPLLLTFYELDAPTPAEINIAKNNRVAFSSKYTQSVFEQYGIKSDYIPLAFDKYNFKKIEGKKIQDGRVTFNIAGKFEKRKHHERLIRAWIKRFGNNPKYFLQPCIYNPHFPNAEQEYQKIIQHLTGGQRIFNVQFYGHMVQNKLYNDYLNSGDIIIGMSGGEGWGLPEFQSVALGKHAVIMNAHGYKEWANEKNSVLVEPKGKIDAADGFFFHKGGPWNQGQIFDFSEEEFIAACEEAVARVEKSRENTEGLKLQEDFSSEKMVEAVLKAV